MTPEKVYNSVSRFQFPMLREFCMAQGYVSVAEASKLDQRPFGSLYHRGWLAHKPGKGFYASEAGRAAFADYVNSDARRRLNPARPLSHYFDPTIYQIHRTEKKVHKFKGAA